MSKGLELLQGLTSTVIFIVSLLSGPQFEICKIKGLEQLEQNNVYGRDSVVILRDRSRSV